MVLFTKLEKLPGGKMMPGEIRTVSHDAIEKCPQYILIPEHYRDDGTCKCDDPDHVAMVAWGYVWNAQSKQWEK